MDITRKFFELGGYEQILTFYDGMLITEKSSCTCKFGSYYGFSEKNKGKICRHLKQAIDENRFEEDNDKQNK